MHLNIDKKKNCYINKYLRVVAGFVKPGVVVVKEVDN